jgi:hypothetical protein
MVGPQLIPYQPIDGAVMPQDLAGSSGQFIAINSIALYYERYGQEEPVFILLHGTLANTYSWHEVVEPLAEMGTVITPTTLLRQQTQTVVL